MPWNADGTYYEPDHASDQEHLHDVPAGSPRDASLQDLLDTYVASAQQVRENLAHRQVPAIRDLDDLHQEIRNHILRSLLTV